MIKTNPPARIPTPVFLFDLARISSFCYSVVLGLEFSYGCFSFFFFVCFDGMGRFK